MEINIGADYSLEGHVWSLKLRLTSVVSSVDQKTIDFDFSMSILDGCLNDELRATGLVDNFNYYIA